MCGSRNIRHLLKVDRPGSDPRSQTKSSSGLASLTYARCNPQTDAMFRSAQGVLKTCCISAFNECPSSHARLQIRTGTTPSQPFRPTPPPHGALPHRPSVRPYRPRRPSRTRHRSTFPARTRTTPPSLPCMSPRNHEREAPRPLSRDRVLHTPPPPVASYMCVMNAQCDGRVGVRSMQPGVPHRPLRCTKD
jgi:hypothetical protein